MRSAVLACLVALVGTACTDSPTADPTTTAPATTVSTTTTTPDETTSTTAPPPTTPVEATALPIALTEVAGVSWRGGIVVAGGLGADGLADAGVHLYDPMADQWNPLPDLPEPLHHTALGVLDDRLYVVGGYAVAAGWVARAEVWSLGPADDGWRPEPPLATPRGALAVASTGDGLIAIGGVGPTGPLASTEILAVGADTWSTGPPLAQAREHLAATAVDDEVYAIAGRVGGMGSNLASVEVLRDGVWHPAPDLAHSRSGIGAAVIGGVPCVAGGEEQAGTIAPIECLFADGWQVVAHLEVPRHGLAVVAIVDRLHVIGGGPVPGLTVSDTHEVFVLSIANGQ